MHNHGLLSPKQIPAISRLAQSPPLTLYLCQKGYSMIGAIREFLFRKILRTGALLPIFALQCGITHPLETIYEPQVVFVGSVTGDYDSLPGNRDWPNTCILKGDTVRMTFFSESFKEVNTIRTGDFVRMDLFPCSTCVIGFTTKHVRFHMARYQSTNISFDISPADTISGSDKISLMVRSLDRQHGGAVDLYNIEALAKPLVGNLGLDLLNGRISGSIE
jgi:hypothetical protein